MSSLGNAIISNINDNTPTTLRRYHYVGRGLALSAVVIVLAPNSIVAHRLASSAMRDSALSYRTLELKDHTDVELTGEPQVIYFWNGDY